MEGLVRRWLHFAHPLLPDRGTSAFGCRQLGQDLANEVQRSADKDVSIRCCELFRSVDRRRCRPAGLGSGTVDRNQVFGGDGVSQGGVRLGENHRIGFESAEGREQLDRIALAQHRKNGDQSLLPDEPAQRCARFGHRRRVVPAVEYQARPPSDELQLPGRDRRGESMAYGFIGGVAQSFGGRHGQGGVCGLVIADEGKAEIGMGESWPARPTSRGHPILWTLTRA